ncbi:halocyanin domain-containing protein [Natronobiforma cellulositropha]|uniref:halocyanin domain-containing protein n=1 Tax=Natronobiforma cellulositropha TaxID=1679076 RepID=UPI0021D5DC3C|nr:halocyanin domain-containing protein [Natronobiforma cellulositropha]
MDTADTSENPADTSVTRRAFLTASTIALATPLATGTASADDLDSWLADVPNYEAVADARGESEVSVTVGADDGFTYDPPVVAVDPGTTVVWEWTGDGGTHDVVDEDGAYESDLVVDAGFTFEHTFEEAGVSRYGCTPHIPMGMKGAVLVGDEAAEAVPAAGGLQSIPLLPGVAASLAIIGVVTAAISRWTRASRDRAQTR